MGYCGRMRYISFGMAALLCVTAIVTQMTGSPRYVALAQLAVAFVFLVVGLALSQRGSGAQGPVELDVEQEKEIKRLLSQGQYGTAVGQVRLWHRTLSKEEAEEMVQNLGKA